MEVNHQPNQPNQNQETKTREVIMGGRSEVRVSEVAVHCRGLQPALMTALLARARICVHAARRAPTAVLLCERVAC